MKTVKRTVMFTVIVLACAGVYGALRNLPVVSGCAFYSECPQASEIAHAQQDSALSAIALGASVDAAAP